MVNYVPHVLFARIGWMHFYDGPRPGDERPIGGGGYNKTGLGNEAYNFHRTGGRLYGYFQLPGPNHEIRLERIDPAASDSDTLKNVLVIFLAKRPEDGGQFIVGWYRNAECLRNPANRSPSKPRGFGHYCSATAEKCVLVPTIKRKHKLFSGKGQLGQANVCYPLNSDGTKKSGRWIQRALSYIADYRAENVLDEPESAVADEIAIAAEKALSGAVGQGFARTPEERRAIEKHSMGVAARYFRDQHFQVRDVSATRSYDLVCKRGKREIHVEVKGTTTAGSSIILTANEVKHAWDQHNSCVLFILHSIKLLRLKATGGKRLLFDPWQPKKNQLTPICYKYRLDGPNKPVI
jgi:hypothetical protein